MTGAHWLILAAATVAAVLVVLLTRRWPRIRGVDAELVRAERGAVDAAHIEHQREWSSRAFGPGVRRGVVDHLRKEIAEVEDTDLTDLGEWVDIIILGFDGAWRAGHEPQAIIDAIKAKQARNERRAWPDWRTADRDKAIEHDRRAEWSDEPGDPTHEQIDQALDVVADAALQWLDDIEQAKVEHTDAAMRRLIGDSPISEDRKSDLLGEWHDRLEHTVPWPHETAEEAADCTRCSPSSLPRRIEGGGEHG